MGTVLALALAFLFVVACNRDANGPQPSCFPKWPPTKPLTIAEQKALADAKLRYFASCRAADKQCGFGVSPSSDGKKIAVHVVFASVEGTPLRCSYVIGSDKFDVYSPAGEYERTIMGL